MLIIDGGQSSGVGVSEECIASFQDIKSHRKFKYIIYGLNPTNTEIIVLKASNETDYDVFVGELPGNECRWAVYDFEYEVEGGKRNKLVFYSWCVTGSKIGLITGLDSRDCSYTLLPFGLLFVQVAR